MRKQGRRGTAGKGSEGSAPGRKRRGAWRARFGELRVSLKHLELLAALNRGDGLAAAARRLNVSQSGASKAARRLEKLLGLTLLEEGDEHLMLSPEGENVAVNAVIVVDALREFQKEVRRTRWAARVRAEEFERWKAERERG